MRLCLRLMIIISICFVFNQSAYSKARFMQLEELVAVSDIIAVIEVIRVEKIGNRFDKNLPKKGYSTYAQKNSFKFFEFIKVRNDNLLDKDKTHILWAEKSFICASASYAIGKYLVFLENVEENEWITINHQRGGLPIDKDNYIKGFDFYIEGSEQGVDLENAKILISNVMFDKEKVSFSAQVNPKSIYNLWKKGVSSQKLVFNIKGEPDGKWPKYLFYFIKGFIKTDSIEKALFEKIINRGGTFDMIGIWKEGQLELVFIQDSKTKKIILKTNVVKEGETK